MSAKQMSPKRMRGRIAAAGVAAACLGLVGVGAAAAASPNGQTVTETTHQHGTWVEPGDTDFCSGATIAPTITGNEVTHVTFFTGSDEFWFTFTEQGTATYDDPVTGLDWAGRITVWANGNGNERNSNQTFTATFKLYATDADGVLHEEVGHDVAHMALNANGVPVVTFDKFSATCS